MSEAWRYALVAVVIALVTGLGVAAVAATRGGPALSWALAGWMIMASIGVGGGAWAVAVHGRPGSGFMLALGACMLARLFASAAGAWGVARQGADLVWPYLAGLGAGYVPLQLFELGWFVRKAKRGI